MIAKSGMAPYYLSETNSVEGMNLGLIKRITPEYAINESLQYVKVVSGNYEFTYQYGSQSVLNVYKSDPFSTVQLQTPSGFTQKLYPSDIRKGLGNNDGSYKVYVVYKIDVTNTTTINDTHIYVEKSLHLTNLVSTYNKDIFELETAYESTNNPDFGRWSSSSEGTAGFSITNSGKKYGSTGIAPNETESTLIQFKVKDTALANLANGSQLGEVNVKANSTGYHYYDRIDCSIKDNLTNRYTHKSISLNKNTSALALKIQLAGTRTISGNVFEDAQTQTSINAGTRVGNGKYDSGENKLNDVIVSLVKADGNVASVYNGNLTYSNGKWTTSSSPAVIQVDQNGAYSLIGVVPGEYYLKFTYGDGSVSITDLNGSQINNIKTKSNGNAINSIYYKSTILTGAATNVTSANKNSWFLSNTGNIATDADGVYYQTDGSVSVNDLIKSRTESDKELNYKSAQDTIVINANGPNMNIQIEYLTATEANGGTAFSNNCTGMDFGIIERPHVDITLEKSISNVKLTLSNGTNIINGNPTEQNVSQYLTSMNPSYAKIEMENDYLYGSTATVTYQLTVRNKSEIDYSTSNYYTKGIEDNSKLVKNAVTKIIDYLSYENSNYIDKSDNVTLATFDEENVKSNYFDPNIDNSDYKEQLLVTFKEDEYLSPEKVGDGKSEVNYSVTVSKLLSNLDDDLGWESYSEIIGLKNVTYTTQYVSHSGNYEAGDMVSFSDGGTSEDDNAESTIVITPSTGEDRSNTIYIVAGIALIILASGVIIIKKFVL